MSMPSNADQSCSVSDTLLSSERSLAPRVDTIDGVDLTSQSNAFHESLLKALALTALTFTTACAEVVFEDSTHGNGNGGGNGGTGGVTVTTSEGGTGDCVEQEIFDPNGVEGDNLGSSIVLHKNLLAAVASEKIKLFENSDSGFVPFGDGLAYSEFINSVGLTKIDSQTWLALGSIHTFNNKGGVSLYKVDADGNQILQQEISPSGSVNMGRSIAINSKTLLTGDDLADVVNVASYNPVSETWESTGTVIAPDGVAG